MEFLPSYRVRARDEPLRVTSQEHHIQQFKNEALEPPTIAVIT